MNIEHGIEVGAEDMLKFLSGAQAAITRTEPQVVAGLGVLLGAVAKGVGDVSLAAADPLNLVLDINTVRDLKAVWPAMVSFAKSVGIKL